MRANIITENPISRTSPANGEKRTLLLEIFLLLFVGHFHLWRFTGRSDKFSLELFRTVLPCQCLWIGFLLNNVTFLPAENI